jgi:hypothetical protein
VRWVLLLTVFAAGFGLGYAVREPESARSTRRAAEPGDRAPSARRDEPEAPAPEPRRRERAEALPTEPVNDAELDPGWGQVLVDFEDPTAERGASLEGRDMFGRMDVESTTSDEGVVEFDVRAGRYRVWWFGPDGERIGTTVQVAAGRATRVRAASQGRPLPLEPGLGRIDVFVAALEGGPLQGATVDIEGDGELYGEGDTSDTGPNGRCRFEVIPGEYRLQLGARAVETAVAAGRTTTVRFSHETEGDLVVRGAPEESVVFLYGAAGEDGVRGRIDDGAARFHYLAPREYVVDVHVHRNGNRDKRRVGAARVLSRRRVVFDAALPTGSLLVRLRTPGPPQRGRPVVELEAADERMVPRRLWLRSGKDSRAGWWRRSFVALTAGVYTVRLHDKDWVPVERRITIGTGPAELDVVLEPAR